MKPVSETEAKLSTEFGDLSIDFVRDHKNYLRPLPKKAGELLPKALGFQKGYRKVFDATAGLLQDAVVMARLGFEVQACERQPQLAKLLKEALEKARQSTSGQVAFEWLARIKVLEMDSQIYLKELADALRPEVIYLDPMFQMKKAKSLPRKEMQIFRQMVGEDLDFPELFTLAQKKALHRVVVKTPLQGDLRLEKALYVYQGTKVQYHIYSTGPRELPTLSQKS